MQKSSAPAHPTKDPARRLAKLEEKLRHELLSEEKRCELADQVVRLCRKLAL
jgi:hypothetical protein